MQKYELFTTLRKNSAKPNAFGFGLNHVKLPYLSIKSVGFSINPDYEWHDSRQSGLLIYPKPKKAFLHQD
jgi:hypothetical protein